MITETADSSKLLLCEAHCGKELGESSEMKTVVSNEARKGPGRGSRVRGMTLIARAVHYITIPGDQKVSGDRFVTGGLWVFRGGLGGGAGPLGHDLFGRGHASMERPQHVDVTCSRTGDLFKS